MSRILRGLLLTALATWFGCSAPKAVASFPNFRTPVFLGPVTRIGGVGSVASPETQAGAALDDTVTNSDAGGFALFGGGGGGGKHQEPPDRLTAAAIRAVTSSAQLDLRVRELTAGGQGAWVLVILVNLFADRTSVRVEADAHTVGTHK